MAKKKSRSKSDENPASEDESQNTAELRPNSTAEDGGVTNNNEDEEQFKGRIDVHTLNYFKRVEKFLEEDSFEDAESRELFLNNVLTQVGSGPQTCQLSKHRLTSKVLEILLNMCSTAHLVSIFNSLLSDPLTVSDDRFGSHVMQKVITIIPKHIVKNTGKNVEEIEALVLQFYKAIRKNPSELIRSVYCCHIINSFIQMLAGVDVSEAISRSRNSRETRTKFFGKKNSSRQKSDKPSFGNILNKNLIIVPESFQKTLNKLAKKIISDDNFGELLCHRNASPVIQTLLLALKAKDTKMSEKLCSLIIEKSRLLEWKGSESGQQSVPILFADEVGSHVMEKIFYVMSADLFEELFQSCFSKNLLALSLHPLANYILQHMLTNITNMDLANQILDELIPFTEDILASGNMGIIVRISEVCLRFKCKQKEFLKALKKSVHLPDTKASKSAFLKLLLSLSTYDVLFAKEDSKDGEEDDTKPDMKNEETGKLTKETINYHGSCLVKNLLQCEKPKGLADGLVELVDETQLLARHEYGSFVIEAFLTSPTVAKTKKHNFLLQIKKDISSIATDKFGSHVIDKLWNQSTPEEKEMIKEELQKSKSLLKGNMYGRIILRNCGIESFKNGEIFKPDVKKKPTELQNNTDLKRNLNEEEIGKKNEDGIVKKKKKLEIDNDVSYVKEFETLGSKFDGVNEMEDDRHDFQEEKKNKKDEIDELFGHFDTHKKAEKGKSSGKKKKSKS